MTLRRLVSPVTPLPTRIPSPRITFFRYGVIVTDLLTVSAAVFLGIPARFGWETITSAESADYRAPLTSILISVIACWMLALFLARSYDARILGVGSAEYTAILKGSASFIGVLAIFGLLTKVNVARGYWMVVLLVGVLGLMITRRCWRKWLVRERLHGRCIIDLVIAGAPAPASGLARFFAKNPDLGYRVVGVCISSSPASLDTQLTVDGEDLPVIGTLDTIAAAVAQVGAHAVAVVSSDVLDHSALREISWQLERTDVDLLVYPSLADVAAPRITVRTEAGVPLLHIDKPYYERATKVFKRTFDVVVAGFTLVLAAPIMITVAVAIRLDSRGPIFYRAPRVGLRNRTFAMWKFRSMVVGAKAMQTNLGSGDGDGLLFKLRDDPRVTRVGRVIRRYSLDELPQLFNVLDGTMSLVGPRPPLPEEVQAYDDVTTRRLYVRPGITGPWQVSGRSDLPFTEGIRLDLAYVENWTLLGDLTILWRTTRAVLSKDGAY